jgi:hypothetical protein
MTGASTALMSSTRQKRTLASRRQRDIGKDGEGLIASVAARAALDPLQTLGPDLR